MTKKMDRAMAMEKADRLARQEKIQVLHPDKLADTICRIYTRMAPEIG